MTSIGFQWVKKLRSLIPKSINDNLRLFGEEGLPDARTYRFPSPGSATPPDISNKYFVKTRPLARVYKYLKKRGEILSLREPLQFTEDKQKGVDPLADMNEEERRAVEFYQSKPWEPTLPRSFNNRLVYKAMADDLGFDIRNLRSVKKNQDKMKIDGELPFSREPMHHEVYDIDTFEHKPRKIEHTF
eukprot:gene9723-11939_t